eukprot:TRINITY_DN716_c1_g1_i1.p1 TRINITY_DN716_c1_g1~~TRINITY_DN716_c1_g1_i1.p1  ORF type:complete len:759 (+),score=202.51 TRINITY_DN716_c1_g1_i1:44-2320(+)
MRQSLRGPTKENKKRKAKRKKNEVALFQARVVDLEKELRQTEEERDAAILELHEKAKIIDAVNEELRQGKAYLSEYATINTHLKGTITRKDKQVQELRQKLEEQKQYDERYKSFHRVLERKDKEITSLRNVNRRQRIKVDKWKAIVKRIATDLEISEERIKYLEGILQKYVLQGNDFATTANTTSVVPPSNHHSVSFVRPSLPRSGGTKRKLADTLLTPIPAAEASFGGFAKYSFLRKPPANTLSATPSTDSITSFGDQRRKRRKILDVENINERKRDDADDNAMIISTKDSSNDDWICIVCDSKNPLNRMTCAECMAPRPRLREKELSQEEVDDDDYDKDSDEKEEDNNSDSEENNDVSMEEEQEQVQQMPTDSEIIQIDDSSEKDNANSKAEEKPNYILNTKDDADAKSTSDADKKETEFKWGSLAQKTALPTHNFSTTTDFGATAANTDPNPWSAPAVTIPDTANTFASDSKKESDGKGPEAYVFGTNFGVPPAPDASSGASAPPSYTFGSAVDKKDTTPTNTFQPTFGLPPDTSAAPSFKPTDTEAPTFTATAPAMTFGTSTETKDDNPAAFTFSLKAKTNEEPESTAGEAEAPNWDFSSTTINSAPWLDSQSGDVAGGDGWKPMDAPEEEVENAIKFEDKDKVMETKVKLYDFDTAEKKWKEKGVGPLRVFNKEVEKKMYVIVRMEATHLVLLNTEVYDGLACTSQGKSMAKLQPVIVTEADDKQVAHTYLLRFETATERDEFSTAVSSFLKK